MKINELAIRHFRSCENVTIYPSDVVGFVGRNNSGKSNILKALELFFEATTTLVSKESFYGHVLSQPVEIWATFVALSDWEKAEFGPWMDGEVLKVGRRVSAESDDSFKIETLAKKRLPAVDWLRPDKINAKAINGWWKEKSTLVVEGINFAEALGSSKPGVGEWQKAAATFLAAHEGIIPVKEEILPNPKGYPGVLKGALPEFICIPAVRDVCDEAKVSKTSPFGQLVNSVLEKVSEKHKAAIGGKLEEIEKLLNRTGGKGRIAEIRDIEKRLNKLISDIMECDVEIEVSLPKLKEVFGGTRIFADDGERTTIEMKGHGLQRSMIFTILRAYAELAHARKAGKKAAQRSTVFAIEEPELYLHPQCQRTLMKVFRDIGAGPDQVFYSTHSSLFVDIARFDDICIMRRPKKKGKYVSECKQLPISAMLEDLRVRTGKNGTEEGIRGQYANAFYPVVNEGLFADKVVLVEGPSEAYSLPVYGAAMGFDFDKNNVSVVHSDGKGPMDRLLRIFSGFGIPSFAVFDGDKCNTDAGVKAKTVELLELLGKPVSDISDVQTTVDKCFCVFESKYEDTLRAEVPDYDELSAAATTALGPHGKPLKHKHMANAIKEKVDAGEDADTVVPATIRAIIKKIKGLQKAISCLKCETGG